MAFLVLITFIYFGLYADISTDILNVTVGFFATENGWEQASLLALWRSSGADDKNGQWPVIDCCTFSYTDRNRSLGTDI